MYFLPITARVAFSPDAIETASTTYDEENAWKRAQSEDEANVVSALQRIFAELETGKRTSCGVKVSSSAASSIEKRA